MSAYIETEADTELSWTRDVSYRVPYADVPAIASPAEETQKNRGLRPGFARMQIVVALALAGLHAGILLVNYIHPPMTAHHATVLVADFRGFQ